MNDYVEALNGLGGNFLSFAWSMLWQSSLLIAVVFAFDLVFARRIRASVRYILWMVVLVKLLLPPALALPTGVTWWLWRERPVFEHPVIQNYSVSFDNTLPEEIAPSTISVVLPTPKLSGDAWVLLVAVATTAGLLSWLGWRWLRVAGAVRRAATAPAELAGILEEARQLAGLRRRPRLKVIDDAQSPAVYGLLRPVILLPRALAAKLSAGQLRAIMLHEAVHLRRGDIWMNCAQTLLQIAYWWHPLLWVANARIRRVREETVDDAVMLALRDCADAYAPTLLEVAKYAFRRPLASLGLVGILESRSALRQRVERLTDFRPPRKKGITLLSLCGILAFSAVALPMGQGPAAMADSFSGEESSNDTTLTLQVNPDVFIRNIKARANWTMEPNTNDYASILMDILEENGVHCVPPHGLSFNKKTGEIKTQNTPEQLEVFRRVIEELNRVDGKWTLLLTNRPVGKNVLIQADLFWMTQVHFEKVIAGATYHRGRDGAAPSWTADPVQLTTMNRRIKSMGLLPVERPRIQTSEGITAELFVHDATNAFRLECDPLVHDTNIFLAVKAESTSVSVQDGLKTTNVSEVYSKVTADDDGGIVVRAPNANGSSNLVAVLNVKTVLPGRATATRGMEMRTFGVGTNVFLANLRKITGAQISNSDAKSISAALTQFFEKAGVDMSSPKTVFFNQRRHGGILFVYATPRDMDIIERIVGILHDPRGGESRWLKSINDGTASDSTSTAGSKDRPQPGNPGDDRFDPISGPKVSAPRDKISYDLGDFGEQVTYPVRSAAYSTNVLRLFDPNDFEQRTFPVGSAAFSANVRKETGEMEPIAGFKMLAAKAGVDLSSPPKTVFLSEGMGLLFVYALKSDMEPIKRIIADLHCSPTMIHIKARFIEVPQKFFSSGMAGDMFPGLTNGGILPSAEFQRLLHEIKSQKGFEELAEPEATTISGRQTQMRATGFQPVVTNYIAGPNLANPAGLAISPQITQVETGPIFDVIPLAFADGYSIGLNATAELRQFFGYASPQGLPTSYATNSAGGKVPLPTSLPALQLCRAEGGKTIYDGQTLVLFPKPGPLLRPDPDKKRQELIIKHIQECEKDDKAEYGNKVLVVLVTATLLDAAGNPFHSEDEMSFAQKDVPPQSP